MSLLADGESKPVRKPVVWPAEFVSGTTAVPLLDAANMTTDDPSEPKTVV